jgi:hypothetical protein
MRPVMGARINDLQRKLLICEESENATFRFPWSKKPRMDFLRPYQIWTIDPDPITQNMLYPLLTFSFVFLRILSTEGKIRYQGYL